MNDSVNFKDFRLSKLFTKEFRHLLLVLCVPVHILLFCIVEGIYNPERATVMYTPLDDLIPFIDIFAIPYLWWYVFILGVGFYLMFADVKSYSRMMYFIALTFILADMIYIFFPTVQPLRPDVFPRDNIFTAIMSTIYSIDPPNNVCPSLHVVGSFAALLGALDSKKFPTIWKWISVITCILVSVSTVFVKQHSILDIFGGIIMSAFGYTVVYLIPRLIKRRKGQKL